MMPSKARGPRRRAQGAALEARGSIASVLFIATLCAPAWAQTGASGRVDRHIDLAVGGGLFTGNELGASQAILRANAVPSSSSPLFSTETRLARAPFFEGWLGYRLTRRFDVEGRFTFSRPELRTSISADIEGGPSTTAVERIDQYLIEGGIVVALDDLHGGRTVPFVAGGAGYLRQLHEGQSLIEEGRSLYVGGGIKHAFYARARGRVKAIGVRAEGRLHFLVDGVAFAGVTRRGALSTSVFVGF